MRRLVSLCIISVLALSCASTPPPSVPVTEQAPAAAVEAPVVEQPAVEPEPVVEAVPEPEPEVPRIPTEAEIVDAVTRYDLEGLKTLLANVDDVKTIVGSSVLLLHLSEEAMGPGSEVNPMTGFLISKKAYTLQRDAKGRGFDAYVMANELGGTPREEYIRSIIGDGFTRYTKTLRADSLDDFIALTQNMPIEERTLLEAVQEKARLITAYILDQGVPSGTIDPVTGEGLIHKAVNGNPYTFAFDNRIDLMKNLVDQGADINLTDKRGDTPLGRLLLTAQSDSSKKLGSPEALIAAMVEKGASVNAQTSQNRSLLYLAANMKLTSTVTLFLGKGAVMDTPSITGFNQSPEIMKLFVKWGADPETFIPNIGTVQDKSAQLEFIRFLLDSGVNPKAIDPSRAAANEDAVKLLVERGADVAGSNILYNWVYDFKGMERVKFLVSAGADLKRTYPGGVTILHLAVQKGDSDLVSYLIDAGAPVNALDLKGKTPLDYCSSKNNALYEVLVLRGAKISTDL